MVNRFDIYLVNLDVERSGDARNTRPCVVISPDEINHNIQNVIIAPISSSSNKYPTRVVLEFLNNKRAIVLDQIRAVDQVRLVKKIGEVDEPTRMITLERLQEMFAK